MNKRFCILVFLAAIFTSAITTYAVENPAKQALVWTADSENGAPSVFRDPKDPTIVKGVEIDIGNAIAREINREPVFKESKWDSMVPGIQRGLYDVIIDAIEITPERLQVVDFSIPYYTTYAQLIVRSDENNILSLADCVGKTIGALKNAIGSKYAQEQQGVILRQYEYEMNLIKDLIFGRLDAIILDHPIALYYAGPVKAVKIIDHPIGSFQYGIAVNKNNKELLHQINKAITKLIANGEFKAIFEKWNLWTPQMAEFYKDHSPTTIHPSGYFGFVKNHEMLMEEENFFKRYLKLIPILGKGALVTLQLSVLGMAVAVICGLLLAIVRIYGHKSISTLAYLYIEIVRGTPLLIQLYFIFFGLPAIGIKLNPLVAGVLGLGLNYASFEAENYRAGIMSVPHGQMEAARALGLTHWQSLYHVVIPQAIRTVIPPVTNDFISLIKDSSLVSIITIIDLTYSYTQLASIYYDYFGIGILVAGIYFLIGFPFAQLGRWVERKLSVDRQKIKKY